MKFFSEDESKGLVCSPESVGLWRLLLPPREGALLAPRPLPLVEVGGPEAEGGILRSIFR